jgi:hypothetical protein
MVSDDFIVILEDKYSVFARTKSRIFDKTNCEPITDDEKGINFNSVLTKARQAAPECVADLLSIGASLVFRNNKIRSKAERKSYSIEIPKRGCYLIW